MAQVVTNENIQQLIETRKVPEFKAPEAPKPVEAVPKEASAPAKTEADALASGQPRNGDGTFASPEAAKAEPEKGQAAPQPAADEDDDPALTEKIRKLIAKKHRAMKEAEEFGRDEARRAMAAEARQDALQRQIEALQGSKSGGPKPEDSSDKEPKPEDFKTVGEYTKALTKYEVAQARKADLAQADQNTQQKKIESAQDLHQQRLAEFAKTVPDYEAVIDASDWDVPHHIAAYLVGEETGPAVGYYLAQHREEADRIAKLKPISAFVELGKLADRLLKKPDAPAPDVAAAPTPKQQVSRAPAPITPLEGKSTPVTKDPSQMSFQELRALRTQERSAGKYR